MVVVGTASEEREERDERVFNQFRIGGPKSLLLAVASLGGVASLLDLTNVEALAPYIVKSETGWAEELPATAIPPAQMMQEINAIDGMGVVGSADETFGLDATLTALDRIPQAALVKLLKVVYDFNSFRFTTDKRCKPVYDGTAGSANRFFAEGIGSYEWRLSQPQTWRLVCCLMERAGLTVAIIRQMTDVLMSFEGPTGHSSFEVVSLGMLFAKAVTVLIFYGWIPPLMRTSVACTYGKLAIAQFKMAYRTFPDWREAQAQVTREATESDVATVSYFKEFKESAEKGHDWHGGTLTFYGFGGSKYDITVYGNSGNRNPFATGMKAYMIAEVGPQMRASGYSATDKQMDLVVRNFWACMCGNDHPTKSVGLLKGRKWTFKSAGTKIKASILKAKKKKIRDCKKRTVAANRLAALTVFAKMVSLHKG